MPELERWVLHRLTELDYGLRRAAISHDWTGVYPELHGFCATDLSAFYFDIRKDALYCDRPDSVRRRACRTVLDVLHRCLTTWLSPMLCFTAEEAWIARFGESGSVHLQTWPELPRQWQDEALGSRIDGYVRSKRSQITSLLEAKRAEKFIGSSLMAAVTLPRPEHGDEAFWEEIAIVSKVNFADTPGEAIEITAAPGDKCLRCWRVLAEVGSLPAHPGLCLRCADAVAHLPDQRNAA
jgi:isoleucyl-tRNA synthetase